MKTYKTNAMSSLPLLPMRRERLCCNVMKRIASYYFDDRGAAYKNKQRRRSVIEWALLLLCTIIELTKKNMMGLQMMRVRLAHEVWKSIFVWRYGNANTDKNKEKWDDEECFFAFYSCVKSPSHFALARVPFTFVLWGLNYVLPHFPQIKKGKEIRKGGKKRCCFYCFLLPPFLLPEGWGQKMQ